MIKKCSNFSIRSLGEKEEWVYDIEVKDTHNFFANDILVHNSTYITLENYVDNLKEGLSKNEIVDELDKFVNDKIEPFIDDCYNELSNYLNAVKNRLIMKREAIGDCGIFRAKKNYVINVYDMEHVRYSEPVLKMMGIETNRTSTPLIIRKKLEECIKLMVDDDVDGLRKTVNDFKKDYRKLHPSVIAYPKGVNGIDKWSDENGNPIKACPKHVRAALTYNKLVLSNDDFKIEHDIIKNGSKIRFLDLVSNNPLNSPVIAFPNDYPEEFGLTNYIDRKKMLEVTFMKPLESFTKLLDYNIRHVNTLADKPKLKNSKKSDIKLKANDNITGDKPPVNRKVNRKRLF